MEENNTLRSTYPHFYCEMIVYTNKNLDKVMVFDLGTMFYIYTPTSKFVHGLKLYIV